tara:strand:- start:64 stop:414 length:351 start_codon:yes stop_codon:yes gene_type:complete
MNTNIFSNIYNLIDKKEIDKAQLELSKLHFRFKNDPEYLFLRSKIFYINRLYYLAVDTLFIALEFGQDDKIYSLLGEIYTFLGHKDLSKKLFDKNLRSAAAKDIKDSLTGIYRKSD